MERLWRGHKEAGLVMVAVTIDANPKLVAPFIERHGFTFTVGLDTKMEVANAYGVRALPSSLNTRAKTRATLPSTSATSSLKASDATAAAVYGPNPGNARSCAAVAGSSPAQACAAR